MLSVTNIEEPIAVQQLVKDFSETLLNLGGSHQDLIEAATMMLDEAIQAQKGSKKVCVPPHLKMVPATE